MVMKLQSGPSMMDDSPNIHTYTCSRQLHCHGPLSVPGQSFHLAFRELFRERLRSPNWIT